MANSALANLDSRTTPDAVRAAVPANGNTGQSVNFSGQYLYDRFIENTEDQTKMGIVRQAIGQVDSASWKKALADMVEIAGKVSETRKKAAQNAQSIMRAAFGAMKFAPDELTALGITDRAGWLVMAKAAPDALKKKGIKWDGTPKPTDEQKTEKARQDDEEAIMTEIRKANPMEPGETAKDYALRCATKYDEAKLLHENNMLQRRIDGIANKIVMDNRDICIAIASRIPELLALAEEAEAKAAAENPPVDPATSTGNGEVPTVH